MTLEQLYAVVKAAETGSISQAAEQLFVTQQTLSQTIIHLEQELGMALFVRRANGVHLTAYGELFVEEARRVCAEFAELTQYGHTLAAQTAGEEKLTIFATPVVNKWLLPACLERLNMRFPRCRIALWEEASGEEIFARVAGEEAVAITCVIEEDFIRNRQGQDDKSLRWQILWRAPLAACVSARSALSVQESISLAQFLSLPLAASGSADYAALWRLADDPAIAAPAICTHHRDLLASAVRDDLAASLYPSILSRCDQSKQRFCQRDYTRLPFAEDLHEVTLFVWARDMRLSPCARELRDMLGTALQRGNTDDD